MAFWHLVVGEAVVWILFHGTWTDGLPWWMNWGGWVGAAIVVGIFSFTMDDDSK